MAPGQGWLTSSWSVLKKNFFKKKIRKGGDLCHRQVTLPDSEVRTRVLTQTLKLIVQASFAHCCLTWSNSQEQAWAPLCPAVPLCPKSTASVHESPLSPRGDSSGESKWDWCRSRSGPSCSPQMLLTSLRDLQWAAVFPSLLEGWLQRTIAN